MVYAAETESELNNGDVDELFRGSLLQERSVGVGAGCCDGRKVPGHRDRC